MTPFVFDTLSASKQLREAGMPEGVAEAVVSVFQHASAMPDISHLASKADIADMATRADLELLRVATKADIESLRQSTSADTHVLRTEMATKAELAQLRLEIASFRAAITDTIRQQGWLLLGGIGVLMGMFTFIGRTLG
ncbi:MAG TPA: hypothetical protein PLO65_04375 [Caulobacter sp.]|nr:hypothetical protein [Caulobacter sp.]